MKRIVSLLSVTLLVFTAYAQSGTAHEICGHATETERILRRNPHYLVWQNAWYKEAMQMYQQQLNAKRNITADTLYLEIPVVFHVLYSNSTESISESLILSQLQELNLAFRKMNQDTQRIRSVFKPIAADVRIQFVMADKDPQGNPSNGITRTQTIRTTFARNIYGSYTTDMKYGSRGGKNAWDPTSYLNIWICNMQYPNSVGIVYGFATPPTGAPNWDNTGATLDSNHMETGVVLHYRIVGRNNPLAPAKYSEGKTAIHEVGHYLGLRHVWGDGSSNTGCSVDDGIFDTPNARQSNASCFGQNTCNDGSGDQPDQTENYMDYALDGCAAMFSRQQAYMMRYVLNQFRSGLPRREIVYDTLKTATTATAEVRIFPNPLGDDRTLSVQISGPENSLSRMDITDMNGKAVLSADIAGNSTFSADLSFLSNSVYLVTFRNADGRIFKREKLILL